jgi:hypothetical protein
MVKEHHLLRIGIGMAVLPACLPACTLAAVAVLSLLLTLPTLTSGLIWLKVPCTQQAQEQNRSVSIARFTYACGRVITQVPG